MLSAVFKSVRNDVVQLSRRSTSGPASLSCQFYVTFSLELQASCLNKFYWLERSDQLLYLVGAKRSTSIFWSDFVLLSIQILFYLVYTWLGGRGGKKVGNLSLKILPISANDEIIKFCEHFFS
jgi:hypothetical protein